MSEYQYYEFAAIDGPISDEGLRYARGCSSRANVSRVRWGRTPTPSAISTGAYAQAGNIGGFQQKLTGFRVRYSNRPAMLRRIDKL
jgi:hypothetical protein